MAGINVLMKYIFLILLLFVSCAQSYEIRLNNLFKYKNQTNRYIPKSYWIGSTGNLNFEVYDKKKLELIQITFFKKEVIKEKYLKQIYLKLVK